MALVDGHYLNASPLVGTLLPVAVLLAGLIVGATGAGYETVFTESLPLLIAIAALGSVSAGLGAMFVVAFAIGDFFIAHTVWQPFYGVFAHGFLDHGFLAGLVRIRLPLLIGYAVLGSLAAAVPTVARMILADIPKLRRLPRQMAFVVAGVLNLLTAAAFTALWVNATPILIRPLFTWDPFLASPTVAAIQPLQLEGGWIVRAAAAAVLLRIVVLWWVYSRPRLARRVIEIERDLIRDPLPQPLLDRLPRWLRALFGAALTTVLLAGLLDTWWIALVMFGTMSIVRSLRSGLIPIRATAWRRLMSRVPALIRLAAVMGLSAVMGSVLIEMQLERGSFVGLALFLLVPIALLYVLMPGTTAGSETST
jgi:hypothetical protein